jgi:hypothetical protein
MSDDELLTPQTPTANDALRDVLLHQTTRRIGAAKRMQYATRGILCVSLFLAGLATTFLRPRSELEQVVVVVHLESPAPLAPESPPKPRSPSELELEAEKAVVRTDGARQFREAGDLYLRDYANHAAALRCYRNFLDEAAPADLAISSEDTWLLTSLKRAREQETNP